VRARARAGDVAAAVDVVADGVDVVVVVVVEDAGARALSRVDPLADGVFEYDADADADADDDDGCAANLCLNRSAMW
jgi:hypothetical protein